MEDLESTIGRLIPFCRELGAYLKTAQYKLNQKQVSTKGAHDLVTSYDKESEKRIVEFLSGLLPEAGFVVEEGTIDKQGDRYNWIVDPIDGTTNFVHGIPCYAISIALQKDSEIILGLVYEINLDEAFYTWKAAPAFLNGKKIRVSPEPDLNKALLATGFPYTDYGKSERYLKVFHEFLKCSRGLRRLGSAAVDLAYVACGRFGGFYEYGLKPWDVAAGALIVQNAGGMVTDFDNGNNYLNGGEILASNKKLHAGLSEKINAYF